MSQRVVSVSREIAAPPSTVFALLADPSAHSRFDGSGTVQGKVKGPERLALGSKFGMAMKMVVPYRITNEVVEFEEGRRIAWRHLGHHIWRYEIEPTESGCLVTESFEWGTARLPIAYELAKLPSKQRQAIVSTLDRLAEVVEQGD